MHQIYNFFDHPFFVILGGIFAIIAITGVLTHIFCWFLGITPLLWRLGIGRWKRKIAIAASDEMYTRLKDDIINSGIFRKNNITHITEKSLSRIKEQSLILLHYKSFEKEEDIKTILSDKKANAGIIIYFPNYSSEDKGRIPEKMMEIIGSKENTTIVNHRGRLLNDIVTTLLTTSYEKR